MTDRDKVEAAFEHGRTHTISSLIIDTGLDSSVIEDVIDQMEIEGDVVSVKTIGGNSIYGLRK